MDENKSRPVTWEQLKQFQDAASKWFRVEPDEVYEITIKSATPIIQTVEDGTEKMKVQLHLSTINGKVTEQIWETGSVVVRNALLKAVQEKILTTSIYILQKTGSGDRTRYTFGVKKGIQIVPKGQTHDHDTDLISVV